ncbi:fimbrial protein [Bordetella genomosp. 12]|uniref:Fimbrial-type adhesion domain-containing protein n=1 Tax=Bordetella genomosp. 12 TaxID=463035 RepID=A0A261VW14_9BORD|nr:fimbrial protein [Bordetella genomosp. 12]OZI77692.1 hypothetical protein CAL22_03945 [Bordetella genomosp. 12]
MKSVFKVFRQPIGGAGAARRGKGLLAAVAGVLATFFLAAPALADCTAVRLPDLNVNFPPTLVIPPNIAANTELATITVAVPGTAQGVQYATCTGNTYYSYYWQIKSNSYVANNVGSTSIDGVGYTASLSGVSSSPIWMDKQINTLDKEMKFLSQVYVTVKLIATKSTIGTGKLTLNPRGTGVANTVATFFAGNGTAGNSVVFNVTMLPNVTTISSGSCSVVNSAIPVTLDPVFTTAFSGVNSTAGEKPFSINLTCPTSISGVYMTLTDSANRSNLTDKLTLTQASTASGVALQILDPSGSPISYGADSISSGNPNQWYAGKPVSGKLNVPLKARYIKTDTQIKGGTVNGLATFTMSYQ